MCAKDRLERARRFAWWRYKVMLSAKGMRSLLHQHKYALPKILQKETLERYYQVQEVDSDHVEEDAPPHLERQPHSLPTVPPQPDVPPKRTSAKRYLMLGGPHDDTTTKDVRPTGATPLDPVTLSSPEYDPITIGEDQQEYEDYEDDVFSPPSQLDLIMQELKEAKEQQRRDQQRVEQMFLSLQTTFQASQAAPAVPPIRRLPTATVTRTDAGSPLDRLPTTSPNQRVIDWTSGHPTPLLAPAHSPAASVAGDSMITDSMIGQVSIDDTPNPPRQLLEGQTQYDWDADGQKWSPRDDVSEDLHPKLQALEDVAKNIANENDFAQDAPEGPARQSKLLGAATPASRSEVTLPLPDEFRDVISNARKPRATKITLLPPLVCRGYRVPKRDWAFLGAVRRPDKILESYCPTKKSAKGICLLNDNKSAALATAHQDTVQATAHTLRPMAASYQAGSTIYDLAQKALQEIRQPKHLTDEHLADIMEQIALLAQFNITATVDAADCLARLNSEAARRLRTVWLDSSRLPPDVKDGVKQAAIEPGIPPVERGFEFTAPIAGEALKRHHDQACDRAKAEKLLSQRAATLQKPAPQKRKGGQDFSRQGWKKPRPNQPQGQQPPRPMNPPRGGGRGGRGGRGGGGRPFQRGGHQQHQGSKPGQGAGNKPSGQGGKSS